MVEREVRRKEEKRKHVKAVVQAQQGAWTRCEGVQARTLKWQENCRMKPILLNFLLWATYDVLPSPANLRVCSKTLEYNMESPKLIITSASGHTRSNKDLYFDLEIRKI